jgi:hypothetical protein
MCLWCQNGSMAQWLACSPLRVAALAFSLMLPVATRSPAYQSPIPQSEQGSANELKLTVAEEKDSYEIYSMLLRTEMPPEWKITTWAITEETSTFPHIGSRNAGNVRECLNVSQDQESTYLPLIQDYVAKNNKKLVLERKFDLPQYSLIGVGRRNSGEANPLSAPVIFHVSAVGFNRDGTRALVYVGHHCGSLCGGGRYHLLVKTLGVWSVDRDYRGMSCMWVS